MWLEFFLENLNFALGMISSLVFFSVAWLYFDAWIERKGIKEIFLWSGFLFLSASFVVSAIKIDSSILPVSVLGQNLGNALFLIFRILGYSFLIINLLITPLIPKPKIKNTENLSVSFMGIPVTGLTGFLLPVLSVLVGFLYLRRATIGLENHLKSVSLVFFILSISEILSLGFLLQNTDNIMLYDLVAPFGIIWILHKILILIATLILGKWAFGYLLKRLLSQLFIIINTGVLVVFLITTITFTALLVRQIQRDTLLHLTSDVKVLAFAIDSRKSEILSDAQVLSVDPSIAEAVKEKSYSSLADISESFLVTKKVSSLIIVDKNGQVYSRGEDKDRIKDSISEEVVVKEALKGKSVTSSVVSESVLAPNVSLKGASPIRSDGEIIGAVIVGVSIDNSFLDGIKKTTGLDASIYGDNKVSATTLLGPDGKTRLLGIEENNNNIRLAVIERGESISGSISVLNTPYYAAYYPLKDLGNNSIGMIFVGEPQIDALKTIARSIELTFLITALLLALSILPTYLISRYISNQFK